MHPIPIPIAPAPKAARILAAAVLASGVGLSTGGLAATQSELPQLLGMMARVAGLYRDAALSFTCQERATETRYRSWGRVASRKTYRFDYFYVFNDPAAALLEGLEPGLQDYRTYVKDDDPAAEPVRVDPGELGLAAHLQRAYSWVFVFLPGLRERLAFELEGRDRALGRDAWVVTFVPQGDPSPDLDWVGRAWIDRETYQLLRVDAASSGDFTAARIAGTAEVGRPYLFTHVRTEFDFEKNGLRFPSDATLAATQLPLEEPTTGGYLKLARRLLDDGIPRQRQFLVQQKYRDYRFFSVRTEEEVQTAIRMPRRP